MSATWAEETVLLDELLNAAGATADRMVAMRTECEHALAPWPGEPGRTYNRCVYDPVEMKSLRSRVKAMRKELQRIADGR